MGTKEQTIPTMEGSSISGKLEEISKDIRLATQADLAIEKENDDFLQFVDTLDQLQLKDRLIREGEARLKQDARLTRNTYKNPKDIVEKTLETTLISEEKAQIYHLSKAIEVCQFSLGLQSDTNHDRKRITSEDELYKTSIELMNVSIENLKLLQQQRNLKKELKGAHDSIQEVQRENQELKENPASSTKENSERIKKLEAMVEKTLGRYDFSRYLTQLLLMESEEDLNKPSVPQLFLKCGESADE